MQDNNGITGVAVPTTGSGAGRADSPAFDTSRAHQARVYDYLLGSLLTQPPHEGSGRTQGHHAGDAHNGRNPR